MKHDELAVEAGVIEREARRTLPGSGLVLPKGSKVQAAKPIRTLAGALQDWFVPVVSRDRLVAYLRFSPQNILKGTSTFMRQPDRLDDCPLAADWLDPERIRRRAQSLAGLGELAGDPFLSFDGAPDRLAWAVPLYAAEAEPEAGAQRWAFVAGVAAWVAKA